MRKLGDDKGVSPLSDTVVARNWGKATNTKMLVGEIAQFRVKLISKMPLGEIAQICVKLSRSHGKII